MYLACVMALRRFAFCFLFFVFFHQEGYTEDTQPDFVAELRIVYTNKWDTERPLSESDAFSGKFSSDIFSSK